MTTQTLAAGKEAGMEERSWQGEAALLVAKYSTPLAVALVASW